MMEERTFFRKKVLYAVFPSVHLPRTVEGFVRSHDHDFSGKRIFPIITHGGTGAGESASVLRDAAPDADLAPVLDVYSSDVPGARGQVAAYLKANSEKQ